MSKMDNLRAMREARYERAAAAGGKKPAAPTPAARPAPSAPEVSEPASGPAPTEGLCGHRAISGKTCTREPGHAEKSHRYS